MSLNSFIKTPLISLFILNKNERFFFFAQLSLEKNKKSQNITLENVNLESNWIIKLWRVEATFLLAGQGEGNVRFNCNIHTLIQTCKHTPDLAFSRPKVRVQIHSHRKPVVLIDRQYCIYTVVQIYRQYCVYTVI